MRAPNTGCQVILETVDVVEGLAKTTVPMTTNGVT
jgi:hypothetical protein